MTQTIYKFRIPVIPLPIRGKNHATNEMIEYIADTWNDESVFSFFDVTELLPVIINMNAINDNCQLFIHVTTNRELSPQELQTVREWITGQCSDGWGENMEYDNQNIRLWAKNREVKYKGKSNA